MAFEFCDSSQSYKRSEERTRRRGRGFWVGKEAILPCFGVFLVKISDYGHWNEGKEAYCQVPSTQRTLGRFMGALVPPDSTPEPDIPHFCSLYVGNRRNWTICRGGEEQEAQKKVPKAVFLVF